MFFIIIHYVGEDNIGYISGKGDKKELTHDYPDYTRRQILSKLQQRVRIYPDCTRGSKFFHCTYQGTAFFQITPCQRIRMFLE